MSRQLFVSEDPQKANEVQAQVEAIEAEIVALEEKRRATASRKEKGELRRQIEAAKEKLAAVKAEMPRMVVDEQAGIDEMLDQIRKLDKFEADLKAFAESVAVSPTDAIKWGGEMIESECRHRLIQSLLEEAETLWNLDGRRTLVDLRNIVENVAEHQAREIMEYGGFFPNSSSVLANAATLHTAKARAELARRLREWILPEIEHFMKNLPNSN